MGLKGRNEVCECSFRTLIALHQWFCAKKQNSGALLLPALSLVFSKLPDFLLTKSAAILFCACARIADTPGNCHAAKQLINMCNSSTCGTSFSDLKLPMFQPATSPVLLIPGGWYPSQRGRCCRQKSSLWLWITFQPLIVWVSQMKEGFSLANVEKTPFLVLCSS